MLDIIDVTLRDGGHAVSFDWPLEFSREYYKIISRTPEVRLIELGYWGQTAKSSNPHYNLNYDKVCAVTQTAALKNVSIMIDYHYCSKDLNKYPRQDQEEISMIRLCSRKQDIPNAIHFADTLKKYSGLSVSLNVFNISNYSHSELLQVCDILTQSSIDYVYFADTHGSLDLQKRSADFKEYIKILGEAEIKAGMHLHDHSGKAYFNFSCLREIGFSSTDASTRGMGKGVGNLKLEHILEKTSLPPLLQFVLQNQKLLTMSESPYGLLSAVYSITDYYAYQAEKRQLSLEHFSRFCQIVSGSDKDVYNESLLINFLKRVV
jgi:4-hydroxy 2-oxovalerate aldolase